MILEEAMAGLAGQRGLFPYGRRLWELGLLVLGLS